MGILCYSFITNVLDLKNEYSLITYAIPQYLTLKYYSPAQPDTQPAAIKSIIYL